MYFVSLTTPMIWMGPLISFHPFRNVLPTALNGLPKNLLAIDSLITATSGACSVSCALKSRPAMNGVSMVTKNPGLIELVHTTDILPRFRHIPFDMDDLVRGTSADRGDIGEARGPDAGNSGETLLQFLVKRQAAVEWHARVARVDTDEQNLVLVEACIERGELRERFEHEPGADQQDQRQSATCDRDQHLSEAEPGVRFHHAARIGLHGRVRVARAYPARPARVRTGFQWRRRPP